MTFPYDVPLKDLLTFFLFGDLVVMVAIGAYVFKTRHKKGKTEQLLEEIRDFLRQNPYECAEKLTSKSNSEATKTAEKPPTEETVKEKPSENKPNQEVPMSSIGRKRAYYEIEESSEASNGELDELNLVENALKDTPVIKPLLKMPKHIDDLIKRSRGSESAPKRIGDAKDADQSTPPPPPPPPTPAQIESTKNNEEKESG